MTYLNQIFKDNIDLNRQEIKDKRIFLSSRPRKLNVALTTRCNLSCIMCEPKKINWEVPQKTLAEVMLFFPYLERVIWQGGEVFLLDYFKDILKQAAPYRNLTHEITTNGHLISPEWLDQVKEINLDLNISVDAFYKSEYERIRKGSKFSDILRFLEMISEIKQAGGKKLFILIMTVMKSNFRQLDEVLDFAKRYNFDRVILQPVKGNHENDENIFYLRDLEALDYIEKIKPKIKERARENGMHLEEWLPTSFLNKEAKIERGSSINDKNGVSSCGGCLFCYAPWEQLFIEWGGGVYPHCLCLEDGPNERRKVGSVLESKLTEIWNNEKMQNFRKTIINNNFQDLCARDCVNGLIAPNLRNLPSGPGNPNNQETQSDEMGIVLESGKRYISQNNYELAIKEFENILSRHPDNAEIHFELGKAHYLKGNWPFAIQELSKSQRLNPKDVNPRLLLAKLYKATGQYALAFESIEPLLTAHLSDAEISREFRDIYPRYLNMLRDRNNQGDYAEVSEKATRLYHLIPQDDFFYSNKALSELEIAQKKLVVSAKMRNLIVTLSTACNLNCVMCEARELNWKIPQEKLEEVISYFPYLERIVWQGGEAFLLDYFDELIEQAAKFPHMRQVITTNGLLIDEGRAENLVKSNVDLTFSIDGVTKEVYEKIREGASFDLLMHNLNNFNYVRKKYKNLLINTNLHAVIMRSNYHQLEDYIDFAREYEFKLVAFLPIGGNFDNPENIFYTQDQEAFKFIENIIPRIEEKAAKFGILVENRLPVKKTPVSIKNEHDAFKDNNINFQNRILCHLPWIQLYIDFDGSIRPDCVCRPDKPIGHADINSLAEVWNNEKMQQYRKLIIDKRCGEICNPECTRGQVSERYLKFS